MSCKAKNLHMYSWKGNSCHWKGNHFLGSLSLVHFESMFHFYTPKNVRKALVSRGYKIKHEHHEQVKRKADLKVTQSSHSKNPNRRSVSWPQQHVLFFIEFSDHSVVTK